MLSSNQIKEFQENGVLVIRDFYDYEADIKPIQLAIYKIIGIIIQKYSLNIKREEFNGSNFDRGFMEILKYDRKYISEIYDAVKLIPSFIRLSSKKEHELIANEIFNSDLSGTVMAGIRIDLPHEEKYRSFWHQEYPAQLRSKEGIVLWSPLVKVLKEMGPVEVLVGSHKEGILPVVVDDSNDRTGAYTLRLHNEDKLLSKYDTAAPLSDPTDLIILDWLVVHQSGVNSSNKARWSMQMRYFNFKEPTGQSIAWSGSYAEGKNFQDIHSELLQKG